MFGFPSDIKDPKLYWGARAILVPAHYERGGLKPRRVAAYIDLLPDRQSVLFYEDFLPEKDQFIDWIMEKALPACRKWARDIDQSSREVFTFEEGEYVLKASPNASYGYLYIGCWLKSKGGDSHES